ncbi:hypothetical protein AB0K94_44035, partial [Streptomyces sp. NPDC053794]|uniref:hypothetical protein n=1 Tax=Streptomyces sp. NPDC053794 TaxID=3154760 RepID=UPI003430B741
FGALFSHASFGALGIAAVVATAIAVVANAVATVVRPFVRHAGGQAVTASRASGAVPSSPTR